MTSTEEKRSVVIVGAGAAGTSVAATLRRQGFAGEVTILDEDRHAPYDRPPLSKGVLSDPTAELGRIRLPSHGELESMHVSLEVGVEIVSVDLGARQIRSRDGRSWHFDELVIATGVAAKTIPELSGDGVMTLRTWDDANALRGALHRGESLVVVGAGFLGLEVAATARALGCDVTVVSTAERPLETRLGKTISRRLGDKHKAEGVNILVGQKVEGLERHGSGDTSTLSVLLDGGIRLDCEAVVVAVGSRPRTEWLTHTGLDVAEGVRSDNLGRVADSVWAVGDVAQWHDAHKGTWTRYEHRSNAAEQGAAVAHSMLQKEPPKPRAPFFWTDQFDAKIQVWGTLPSDGGHESVLAGDPQSDSFVLGVSTRPGNDPVAVLAWNATKLALPHRLALERRLPQLGEGAR